MSIMSAVDIAYLYIYRFFGQEPTRQEKIDITQQVQTLLGQGWTDKDIVSAIRESTRRVPLSSLLQGKTKSAKNLLNPTTFYYHHELRIIPPPAPVIIEDDLITQQPATEYYLEMRASYTMDDLTAYYIDKFGIRPEDINRKRYEGSFNWLLYEKNGSKRYDIDLVLFMIDACAINMVSEIKDRPLSPMEIGEYVDKAREIVDAKRTEEARGGINKVTPRKRVLDFSNRKTAKM